MATLTELVRELRDQTGAGVMDCRRALTESDNDLKRAVEWLRQKGVASVSKKKGREAREGLVEAYVHGGRLGALIELNCETDFVGRTEEFKNLARDIAMHVAVTDARYLGSDAVPVEELEAHAEGKPRNDFLAAHVLLHQTHIRHADKTINQLLEEAIAKLGENVVLRRFARFQLGSDS